jgi:hypothetical protein
VFVDLADNQLLFSLPCEQVVSAEDVHAFAEQLRAKRPRIS